MFLWRQGFKKDIPFRAEFSKVFHSLHIMQLWESFLITIYIKEKLLWRVFSDAQIYGYSNMFYEWFYCYVQLAE